MKGLIGMRHNDLDFMSGLEFYNVKPETEAK